MTVNDNVECINANPLQGNDIAPPLNKGSKYTIKEILKCSCGKEHFNVGLKLDYNYVRCHSCNEELPTTNHWCHPSRFTL